MVDEIDAMFDTGETTPVEEEPEPENYTEHLMKTKGYKTPEEIAKAYYHADKQITKTQGENKNLREYAALATPYVKIAEDYLKKQAESGKEMPKLDQAGKEELGKALSEKDSTEVKKMMKEMMGPQFDNINKRLTQAEIATTLKDMRSDKDNFKYMNKDTENGMADILKVARESGRPIEMTPDNLKSVYFTAIGRNVNKIIDGEKKGIRDEAYSDFLDNKGSSLENDRKGSGGKRSTAEQSVIDSILNADGGKSLF